MDNFYLSNAVIKARKITSNGFLNLSILQFIRKHSLRLKVLKLPVDLLFYLSHTGMLRKN